MTTRFPGFQQKTLNVKTGDGIDDVLLEQLFYVSPTGQWLCAPAGGTTDGMKDGGDWVPAHFTRKQCDDLMWDALEMQGVHWLNHHVVYWMLRLFGWKSFNDDRAKANIANLV